MSSWWSQCPWGKPRPYEWLPQPFTIHPGGGGGWWRDTQVPPYGRLSFPCAIHPAWAVGCGGVGRTESSAPTQGLRYRLPFNPAGRASPPHPSASLTPSPPGEGRAVICFHLPFDREGRWALPCWRDTQVPPYGGNWRRVPCNRAGRASPPHPSASLTPSPPGEGRAGFVTGCHSTGPWRVSLPGSGRRGGGPYGGLRCRVPFSRRG